MLLWANVAAMMKLRYGREQLGRFAAEVGIGPASMTRIRAQKTAVGLDIIESIAARFDLNPWQMLAPELGRDLHMFDGEHRLVPALTPTQIARLAQPDPPPHTPQTKVIDYAHRARGLPASKNAGNVKAGARGSKGVTKK